ncbi:hypothetical protein BGZ61DRAFT_526032 [Ilyonectria robusta]|uniref:uncharacterized protein n=1 Tax=Ilyonectria robusta TaxID=1079257 RepID=UPI001E8CEA72|nr:uncharacterized protein BGZ61DRAFT_526032 [Ilyonectria robusta]KAH8737997.1 hypothetical protein BGZ61DRAFT_526032 [Ilyonectria robusta]
MDTPAPNQVHSEVVSSSSSTTSFFSNTAGTKSSAPEMTPSSTPSLKSEDDTCDTCKIGTRPLSPLQREFPKPAQDVDVKAMLEREPGRWSIQGQIAANQQRHKPTLNEEELKERRARDFEAAKKDLLAFQSNNQPPNHGSW